MGPAAATMAALGWRSHSGWAVLVAVGGSPKDVVILHRDRVELLDRALPRQPYHAAVEGALSLDEAIALIARVERAATLAAASAINSVVANLNEFSCRVVGVGLAAGGRRIPGDLTQILASHALLHAAEGDLYERVIMEASATEGLPVSTLPTKTIFADAARAMSTAVRDLDAALVAAGKRAGPPWQKDHREAAAAALVALGVRVGPSG